MYILASDKYCTICNGNCKSIHACKLFMLSPSLPTHPFYLTCLEFVGRMCSSHSCFMFWNFFFFPLFLVSPPQHNERSLKFHLHSVYLHPEKKQSEVNYSERLDSGVRARTRQSFWQTLSHVSVGNLSLGSPEFRWSGCDLTHPGSVNIKKAENSFKMVTQESLFWLVESTLNMF